MNELQKKRLAWVKEYHKVKHAGRVCLKYGISRPTLRKWLKRYNDSGFSGL